MKKIVQFVKRFGFFVIIFNTSALSAQWVEQNGVIWTDQKVGVQTSTPEFTLDVNGSLGLANNTGIFVRRSNNLLHEVISMDPNNDIVFNRASINEDYPSSVIFGLGRGRNIDFRNADNVNLMRIVEDTGNIYVDGKITCTEVEVKMDVWPDYVFADHHSLMPLYEVERYILENRHLPDVPAGPKVLEHGIELGHMSAILLKKVEELTLYLIQISKENEDLRQRISVLEK